MTEATLKLTPIAPILSSVLQADPQEEVIGNKWTHPALIRHLDIWRSALRWWKVFLFLWGE